MTEETKVDTSDSTNQSSSEQQAEKEITIHNIYLKSSAFDAPNSPSVFTRSDVPEQEMTIDVQVYTHPEDNYEIVLDISIRSIGKDENLIYEMAVQYGGIFTVKGFTETEMPPILYIYCASQVYPYLRSYIANQVTEGSFPKLVMQHLNFEAIFQQKIQQLHSQKTEDGYAQEQVELSDSSR